MIILAQVILVFYVLGCISFGSLMMRLIAPRAWKLEAESTLTVITTYFLIGVGILGGIWVVVALLGWLSPARRSSYLCRTIQIGPMAVENPGHGRHSSPIAGRHSFHAAAKQRCGCFLHAHCEGHWRIPPSAALAG
jgi:hypothetical protein